MVNVSGKPAQRTASPIKDFECDSERINLLPMNGDECVAAALPTSGPVELGKTFEIVILQRW